MNKIVSDFAQGFVNFTNRSLIKNLIIIALSIVLVFTLLFFPYQQYSSAEGKASGFEVGIHYVFEQDDVETIYSQVARIHDLGFKTIRITMECDPTDYMNIQNRQNNQFFVAANSFGMKVALVIKHTNTFEKVDYYLNRWGDYLSYIQVFNEPEFCTTWSVSAMFSDDEIISKFDLMHDTIAAHNLPVQYYTNFGIVYLLRSNIPLDLSKKLDFVGLDIFMDSFLELSPHLAKNLHEITGKDVVITEFGMSTRDEQTQTDFLIKGLNLFKNMGLRGCWLVYWNSAYDQYGIRDRLAEQAVKEWIGQNA